MSLKYAGAQITAAEERRSAASPSIAAPSQLMTASFPLKFMRTTAEAEFREQREFGDGRKRPRVSATTRAAAATRSAFSAAAEMLQGVGGAWAVEEGGGEIFTARRVSASIAVASRVPSSAVMEGGQGGNEDGGNNDCAREESGERVEAQNKIKKKLTVRLNLLFSSSSDASFICFYFLL